MKRFFWGMWIAGMCCALPLASAADTGPDEAGVRAAENAWNKAFMTGDAKALDDLLDPGYVSVNANGTARPKADIIALAQHYAAEHPNAPVTALAPTSIINVKGHAAVVTHHAPNETSVDVFYYNDGRWHAWYSQHTRTAAAS